jgi:hypothetical protein
VRVAGHPLAGQDTSGANVRCADASFHGRNVSSVVLDAGAIRKRDSDGLAYRGEDRIGIGGAASRELTAALRGEPEFRDGREGRGSEVNKVLFNSAD